MFFFLFFSFVRLSPSCGAAVPDGVVGPEADPLRDGAVLLLGLGQLLLGAERLVGLIFSIRIVNASCRAQQILQASWLSLSSLGCLVKVQLRVDLQNIV